MVFTARGTALGLKHRTFAWTRLILRRPSDWYIKNQAKNAPNLPHIENSQSKYPHCQVCGYVMLRTKLENGWVFETCSAFRTMSTPNELGFKQWVDELPSSSI